MRSQEPIVSVCIPTYNRAALLKESIESVLNQSFKDFELIIADNASEDETESVVKSFDDERIIYARSSNNIGVVKNWNRCLTLSKGTYIAIFHDDDVMMPDNLAEKVSVLSRNQQVGLVHSRFHVIDAQGRMIQYNASMSERDDPACDTLEHSRDALATLLSYNPVHVCTAILRKECYEKLGGFSERLRLFPDWEYWMRIASCYDVAFLAKPLIKGRTHIGSLTQVTMQRSRVDMKIAVKNLEEDLAGMRWMLERYLPLVSKKTTARKQMWLLMGNRVADYAKAMLGDGGPVPQVRAFLWRICSRYPEVLIQRYVWKVFLKSLFQRQTINVLKRISRL